MFFVCKDLLVLSSWAALGEQPLLKKLSCVLAVSSNVSGLTTPITCEISVEVTLLVWGNMSWTLCLISWGVLLWCAPVVSL